MSDAGDAVVREYLQAEERVSPAMRLVNPFKQLSGPTGLVAGLIVVAATVAVAVLGKVHYDGIMDVHVGAVPPAWFFAFEAVADWLVVAILFCIAGASFGSGARQVVDYFGMSGVGRAPFVLAGLITAAMSGVLMPLVPLLMAGRFAELLRAPGFVWVVVGTVATMLVMLWGMFLNYFAMRESGSIPTAKAIPVYIGVIIVGEIVSKVLIWLPVAMGMVR